MICKTCGAVISSEDIFCGECGMPIIAERKHMTKCSHCGSLVQEGESFCGECGTPLSTPTETTMVACPRCGAPSFSGNDFCGECGFHLTGGGSRSHSEESSYDQTVSIGASTIPSFITDAVASAPESSPYVPEEPLYAPAPAYEAPPTYTAPPYYAPPMGLKTSMPPAKAPLDPVEAADQARGKSLFSRPDDSDDLL